MTSPSVAALRRATGQLSLLRLRRLSTLAAAEQFVSDARPDRSRTRCGVNAHVSPIRAQLWQESRRGRRASHATSGVYDDADVDPFALVAEELEDVRRHVVSTAHAAQDPTLNVATQHFFQQRGKMFRPMTVLLIAHAATRTGLSHVLPSQKRMAEIAEMIHAASLLHDDVIDVADTRRGLQSVNSMLGNFLAVQAGDFVLARASAALGMLNNCDVVEILSRSIMHLVNGEVLQLNLANVKSASWNDYFDKYLEKTFYKTASLIASSCRAVLMLGDCSDKLCDAAYEYGKNLGICFQLVDDALDMSAHETEMGKPTFADLRAGNATAPVLFALQDFPMLEPIVRRRFECEGDVEFATEKIVEARGVERTLQLAGEYSQRAVDAVMANFSSSPYRAALVKLTEIVHSRRR